MAMSKAEAEKMQRLLNERERLLRKIKYYQTERNKLHRELEVVYDYYNVSDEDKNWFRDAALQGFE